MKIAFFSPLSPIKSGISSYSEDNLLPYFKKYGDIDVFIDGTYSPTNKILKNNFNILSYKNFQDSNYDIILYHLGNNPYHEYIHNTLIKHPGIVVVHDAFISGLIWNLTIAKGKPEDYEDYMEYCLGEKGRKIAVSAITTNDYPSFEYPLIKKVADSSVALIVHSDYAKKVIAKEAPDAFIKKIKMPIPITNVNFKTDKTKFGISNNTFVISTFGFIASHKRLIVILKAFATFLEKHPNSKFCIVGSFLEENYEKEVKKLIKELDLTEKVTITGFVDDLIPHIQVSDIIIQLRYPTAGETSIITLDLMRFEKPIIISNAGWFRELPNDVAQKINVDEKEEFSIVEAFLALYDDTDYRKKLSLNARKYIETEHNPEKIAFEFAEFLSYMENSENRKYLKQFSLKLKELGIDKESPYLDNVIQNLKEIV